MTKRPVRLVSKGAVPEPASALVRDTLKRIGIVDEQIKNLNLDRDSAMRNFGHYSTMVRARVHELALKETKSDIARADKSLQQCITSKAALHERLGALYVCDRMARVIIAVRS